MSSAEMGLFREDGSRVIIELLGCKFLFEGDVLIDIVPAAVLSFFAC
jgi:hypothetical protein